MLRRIRVSLKNYLQRVFRHNVCRYVGHRPGFNNSMYEPDCDWYICVCRRCGTPGRVPMEYLRDGVDAQEDIKWRF